MSGGEARILGQVAKYADLHTIMRARADELQLSRQTIDQLARLQPGYASKLLAPRPMRRLTDETLSFVLPALGLKLVAVEDLESLAQIRARSSKRNNGCVHAGTVEYKISRRELRRRQRKGGKNSRSYMSKKKATALSRKANLVRWRDIKAAVARAPSTSPAAVRPTAARSGRPARSGAPSSAIRRATGPQRRVTARAGAKRR